MTRNISFLLTTLLILFCVQQGFAQIGTQLVKDAGADSSITDLRAWNTIGDPFFKKFTFFDTTAVSANGGQVFDFYPYDYGMKGGNSYLSQAIALDPATKTAIATGNVRALFTSEYWYQMDSKETAGLISLILIQKDATDAIIKTDSVSRNTGTLLEMGWKSFPTQNVPIQTVTKSLEIRMHAFIGNHDSIYKYQLDFDGISLVLTTPPTVANGTVASITRSGATLNGSYTASIGSTVTEVGFVYSSTNNTPTIGGSGVIAATAGNGASFSKSISGLSPSTLYYFRTYATNAAGTSYGAVQSFTTLAPAAISQVSPPADNQYSSSSNLDYIVKFAENVTVTGAPFLTLTVGSSTKQATYVSGSGNKEITFRYTIASGDADADGVAIQSNINLNSGTIKDANNVAVSTTFSGSTATAVRVDGIAPVISSVVPQVASANHAIGSNLIYVATFSEPVNVTGSPNLTLTIGNITRQAAYLDGNGTNTIRFQYTAAAGDFDADGVSVSQNITMTGATIKDAAGNAATTTFTGSTATGVLVDGIAPSISKKVSPISQTYKIGSTLNFTITFNEAVIVTETPSLSLTIGTLTKTALYVSGSGTTNLTFAYTIAAGDADADGIALEANISLSGGTIKDAVGNPASTVFSGISLPGVIVDGMAPRINQINPPNNAVYVEGQNIDVLVIFDEPVNVIGNPSLILSVGTSARFATYLSGSGTDHITFRYTVANGDYDADGIELSPDINMTVVSITDTAGNPAITTHLGSTFSGVLADAVLPSIASVNPPTEGIYKEGSILNYSVKFSKNVSLTGGTPFLSITVGSEVRKALYSSGSGTDTWTFSYTIAAGEQDLDGVVINADLHLDGASINDVNNNNSETTFSAISAAKVTVDAIAPTITNVAMPAQGTYSLGDELEFKIRFSENVSVADHPNLSLVIGTSSKNATYLSGSGTDQLTFQYTIADGDLDTNGILLHANVDLNEGTITDIAGNASILTFEEQSASNVLIDAIAPTIISVLAPVPGNYLQSQTLAIKVNFNEKVTVAGSPTVSLRIGSAIKECSFKSGSGSDQLTFQYTIASGDIDADGITILPNIALNGGSITDRADNVANIAFNEQAESEILVDAVTPSVSKVAAPTNGNYKVASNIDFTLNFSEAVKVTGSPQIRIDLTRGGPGYAAYVSGSGTTKLKFRYVVANKASAPNGIELNDSIDLNGGSIKDLAGNAIDLLLPAVNCKGITIGSTTNITQTKDLGNPQMVILSNEILISDIDNGIATLQFFNTKGQTFRSIQVNPIQKQQRFPIPQENNTHMVVLRVNGKIQQTITLP